MDKRTFLGVKRSKIMKLGETTVTSGLSGTSLPKEPTSVLTEKKSSIWTNPIILWVVIGIMFLTISYGLYYIITIPNISKIQKEADALKTKLELIIKEYELSKNVYEDTIKSLQKKFDAVNSEYQKNKKASNAKIFEISKKYDNLQKEYNKTKREYDNITKPTTKKERIERLKKLGYEPIIK